MITRQWGDEMVWFLVFHIYVAPADAVDWDGPWTIDDRPLSVERYFSSQAECDAAAKKVIDEMHQGMLAPMRYNCVAIPSSLSKGAPR